MAIDILSLGGIVFTDFATPEHIPFGGDHAMVVHKLPGGGRVIDMLGPDDMDIRWSGRFWGDGAMAQAVALDAMRRSGQQLPLTYAGLFQMVVINNFEADIERFPHDVLYHISCTPIPAFGGALGGGIGGTVLAAADIAAAVAL